MSDDQSIGVIYVEDDDDVRIGGVQALELAGFSVSGFASVETAGASVRSDMPFVVVCDVRLRGKSGLEWLSDLRRLDQDLPVILIVRIEDRDLVRLLQHLDLKIPKDVGHGIEQTLVVRIRECLARPRDFAELLDDIGGPRLQDRAGGIADQLIEVALKNMASR